MRRLFKVITLYYFIFPLSIFGQNYINNPYSRFAIGDLINTGLGYNRSLGGSSIALRPFNQINYLNPASYTSQDTMSFLFQGGITCRSSLINTNLDQDKTNNLNIEYLTIGFPIAKWWKFSIGLVPYSRINYLFREYPLAEEYNYISIDYQGDGGFNEFYFGTSYEIKNFLSIGVNACYLFGSLNKERIIDNVDPNTVYTNPDEIVAFTRIQEEYIASDFYFRFGLQAYKTYGEKHTFILGATFDGKTNIKIKENSITNRGFFKAGLIYVDTFKIVNDSSGSFTMPMKYGLGFSYVYNNILFVTTEFTSQDFRNTAINKEHKNLSKYNSWRFGAEYIPVPFSSRKRASYIERIHYRIGGHFTNTYLNIAGTQINDYGFSIGLGLPWRNPSKLYTYSSFNLSYEYGVRGTTNNDLIKENYHIITIGFTLHDFWFRKPKYD
ncbi:MAG: hypothetical protein JXB24_06275 [Bacteroidales bacterium]|nr:hypothetical protein [Bacteroidales bacterium]